MGALHAGHAALFRMAKEHGDVVIATIFVNPRQFSDPGDLRDYPRSLDADRALAAEHGVDCLIEPTLGDMWPNYPAPTATSVVVGALGDVWEGADRPGHFTGVASVVAKLLSLTGPCRAYFGEKDFQQLVVLRQMVRDLAIDADVVGCPVVRDEDGLALSSRNARLSAEGRARARSLSRALTAVASTPGCASELRQLLRDVLADGTLSVAYADVVNPSTLAPCEDDESGERRALVAGIIEGVRLIDNTSVTVTRKAPHAVSH